MTDAIPATEPFGVHVMTDGYRATGPQMTEADALRGLLEAEAHVQERGLRYPAATLVPEAL